MSARAGAAFLFDARAWERPEARHTVATLASLLELPVRTVPPGGAAGEAEAPVFVGDPAAAPADAAVVIPCLTWERWAPGDVHLHAFEGVPLPCAGGPCAPPEAAREFPLPWLRAAAWMLQREEELAEPHRDEWECFAGFSSRLHELGVLEAPLVNRMAAVLEKRVRAWLEARHVTPPRRPRWKDGARFAVALTHDVDHTRLRSLTEALRLIARARTPGAYAARRGLAQAFDALLHAGRAGDPYWTFDRWTGEEARHGFRSTFYLLPPRPARPHEYDGTYDWDDPVEFEGARMRVRDLLRAFAARGFEVGLHGAYRSHRDGGELARQRRQVEEALGGAVSGLRQHFLRFDVRATWAAQQAAGFAYDSTLGYNEALGFRAGIVAPFHPFEPGARVPLGLLELPLTCMDGTLFRTLKLDRALAARRVRGHLEAVQRAGGLAVLLWHPNAADPKRYPGWFESYADALADLAERPAWVAPAGEIAAWWREREAAAGD